MNAFKISMNQLESAKTKQIIKKTKLAPILYCLRTIGYKPKYDQHSSDDAEQCFKYNSNQSFQTKIFS